MRVPFGSRWGTGRGPWVRAADRWLLPVMVIELPGAQFIPAVEGVGRGGAGGGVATRGWHG